MYDGHDVVLVYDDTSSLTSRFLHGPAVDQVFAPTLPPIPPKDDKKTKKPGKAQKNKEVEIYQKGPSRIGITPHSVIIVTDDTAEGDSIALWMVTPWFSGVTKHTAVSSWAGVDDAMNEREDESVSILYLSGHGSWGGVQTQDGVDLWTGSLKTGSVKIIKEKLKPGGMVILLGCGVGNDTQCQDLANMLGVPVIANTGDVNQGDYGEGDWLIFRPKLNKKKPEVEKK